MPNTVWKKTWFNELWKCQLGMKINSENYLFYTIRIFKRYVNVSIFLLETIANKIYKQEGTSLMP